MPPPETKLCSSCGAEKRRAEFGSYRSRPDGLNPRCKTCHAAASREWRQRNPEKSRDVHRRYYAANVDAMREASRRWREENREASREQSRRYREANPEAARQQWQRWKIANSGHLRERNAANNARRRGAQAVAMVLVADLEAEDWGFCMACGRPLGDEWEWDHVIPIRLGGEHTLANSQRLHPWCHRAKTAADRHRNSSQTACP